MIDKSKVKNNQEEQEEKEQNSNNNTFFYTGQNALQEIDRCLYRHVTILKYHHIKLQKLYFTSEETIEALELQYLESVQVDIETLKDLLSIRGSLQYVLSKEDEEE